ncbi:MAG: hypothetical protein JO033_19260 [Acidobacteriaceae bacterium]|nr:hypothetical protein [Acidobacteriaceae bacterium]MBV9498049.1 hypothetical protein [Acidobacteriaceae bacterium]
MSRNLAQACDLVRDTPLKLPPIVWRWREFLDSNYPDTRSAVVGLFALPAEDRDRYCLLLMDLFGLERLGRRTAGCCAFCFQSFLG